MWSPVREIAPLLNAGVLSKKMPSSYKIDGTLISKILEVIEEEMNEFRTACYGVEDIHDIDNKFGENIDNFATNYDMRRNGNSDSEFIKKIKIKLSSKSSLGDNDTIIKILGDYFSSDYANFSTNIKETRKIEVFHPGELDTGEVLGVVKSIKAAGIRVEITPDKYWSDLNYEEPLVGSIADSTYEELEELRYEREV